MKSGKSKKTVTNEQSNCCPQHENTLETKTMCHKNKNHKPHDLINISLFIWPLTVFTINILPKIFFFLELHTILYFMQIIFPSPPANSKS